MSTKQMTVAELIERLNEMDMNAPVEFFIGPDDENGTSYDEFEVLEGTEINDESEQERTFVQIYIQTLT